MLVTAALLMLYVACVGLFHAHPARSTLSWVAHSNVAPTVLRVSSILLLAIALFYFALEQGFERGAASWFGGWCAVGFISLWVSALKPNAHLLSGAISLAAALLLPALSLLFLV